MSHFQQKTHSIWQEIQGPEHPPLNTDRTTDVCIVGAGISGLTTAYRLLKEGVKVLVIDKESFGRNETGLSTAHLSNALDDRYALLKKWHGTEGSRRAYESHTEAIQMIEHIVQEENIDCEFMRTDGYLFLGPEHDINYLKEEMAAAHEAGFTEVGFLSRAPVVFFESGPCLHFPHQAQIDPLKYLKGLAQAVTNMGGEIYFQTRATQVVGGPEAFVKTDTGATIHCRHIVVTTNVPINDLVTMHTKEAAYRTYAIGIKVPVGQIHGGLFWDTSDPYHYVRAKFNPSQDYDLLIVGGEDHRVGQCEHPEKQYLKLRDWVHARLGFAPEVLYHWSGQIIEPIDGLAYIGRNPGDEKNVYIVSGDSGHGTTHGTLAGGILSDLIAGRDNKYAALYDPGRFNWKCLDTYARENLRGAMQYADWFATYKEEKRREDLAPGEGGIFMEGIHKFAVYRDLEGEFHEFSAACPHLRGVVHWNETEQTWDCPFHGSRFSKMGEVLNGPALSGLTPRKPEPTATAGSEKVSEESPPPSP